MVRYHKISNGIECIIKKTKGVVTMKRCRKIENKEKVSTRKLLNSLGIRSL